MLNNIAGMAEAGDAKENADMRNSQNSAQLGTPGGRPMSLKKTSAVPGGGLGPDARQSLKFDPKARASRTSLRKGAPLGGSDSSK